jgi:hypothetical protein
MMRLSLNGYSKTGEKFALDFEDISIEEVDFIIKHERWSVGILETESMKIILDCASRQQNKFFSRPKQC